MAIIGGGQRIAQVLEQVPAIRHLDSLGSPYVRGFRISAGPISANDFNTGLSLEPDRQCLGLPVREQFNDLMPLQVHQDRARMVRKLTYA
jgi:hypothetical protein